MPSMALARASCACPTIVSGLPAAVATPGKLGKLIHHACPACSGIRQSRRSCGSWPLLPPQPFLKGERAGLLAEARLHEWQSQWWLAYAAVLAQRPQPDEPSGREG